jgi:stage II sporulation protein D
LIFSLLLFSCSSTTRFPGKEVTRININRSTGLRVLLTEAKNSGFLNIESTINLFNANKRLTVIKAGETVGYVALENEVIINVQGEKYESEKFIIDSFSEEDIIKINGNKYRGKIQISSSNSLINLVNIIEIEDYVKGVLPKEMPIGKNNENFEALKALAICIRTYAVKKMVEGKLVFDLYGDTRDQVYGGADSETTITNNAVDETRKVILKYDGKPATIYYHSTCGGYTESVENVFTKETIPYLRSIEDGNEPYCKISPRFKWKENYTKEKIIERLQSYSLLDNQQYELKEISILNKFDSGRVEDLEIIIKNEYGVDKSLLLHGNEIRSILRTADNKNILWSTMFDISNDDDTVILNGYGFGHGVGLCQWGAIALSREGWSYRDILEHYFPTISITIN